VAGAAAVVEEGSEAAAVGLPMTSVNVKSLTGDTFEDAGTGVRSEGNVDFGSVAAALAGAESGGISSTT
jgi:hypothetical protein